MSMRHILVDQGPVEPSCSVLLVSFHPNMISSCTQGWDAIGLYYLHCRNLDSLVGTATGCGLDALGFDSQKGQGNFLRNMWTDSGGNPASYSMETGDSLSGSKAAEL
jgi:hypothetical protein